MHLKERIGNDVKVVEQPFGVGAKGFLATISRANLAIGAQQAAPVPNKLLKQRPPNYAARWTRVYGQVTGMYFQAI